MSRVDDLISELAPSGVPFYELAAVARTLPGLSGKSKADFSDGNARFVSYKNAFANISVDQACDDFVKVYEHEKQNRLNLGDVVITGSSESLAEVGMSSVIDRAPEEALYLNSFCFIVRFNDPTMILPGFSKYLFRSDSVRSQITRTASGVTRINISKPRFLKVRIPVPPLEVQREVLRILDEFTELEAELEAELQAELQARRTQYDHYRRHILHGDMTDSEHVSLHDVSDIAIGFPFISSRFSNDSHDVALVRGDNVGQGSLKIREFKRWKRTARDGLDTYELAAGDVVLAMDRPWIPAGLKWARIAKESLPALLVQRVARLRARAGVLDQQFLGCLISSSAFTEHVMRVQTGNTVPHISGKQIGSFSFPLPPLDDQIRLAAALDKLDALVNDLSVGLPAELVARRKQYEYYRNRLLTFEEVAA